QSAENPVLFLLLGGAAVHRCDDRLIFMTALAAEDTLSAREPVFPQPVRGWPSRLDFFRSLLCPTFLERPRRRFFIVEHFKNREQLGDLEKLTYALGQPRQFYPAAGVAGTRVKRNQSSEPAAI